MESSSSSSKKKKRTGYVFEELYMWHDPGSISFSKWVEPGEHWENADSKRRLHGILAASGLLDKLIHIKARHATRDDITKFHTGEYHDRILEMSNNNGGDAGEIARFSKGGYEIAALSAGGLLAAIDSIVNGEIDNAYCLVRPPGHHATPSLGMGFCIFNNVGIAAHYARSLNVGIKKIAIIDYDVHHGNGTQDGFYDDNNTLFVSLHQDNNYPIGTGRMTELGTENAYGKTINVPLPPGTGNGGYQYAFDRVVIPAVYRFQPDFIFVSSGFDASFCDPLGRQMLSSESFGIFTEKLLKAADDLCQGKILFSHEGGYSKDYVPFCGIAVIEKLSNETSAVVDSYLDECKAKGYHDCQPHQAAVADAVAALVGLTDSTTATDLSPCEQGIMNSIKVLLDTASGASRQQLILKHLINDSSNGNASN